MVHRKKPMPVQESNSEGEEFSDFDHLASSDSNTFGDLVEDSWVFPVIRPKALRCKYEEVCEKKSLAHN